MSYYVYILKCGDGTLYTGWTNNLEDRLTAHREGRGAKYTRGRRPLDLVYTEEHPSKSEAAKREYQIKSMTRRQKERLIDS
ncbi:MAG TPA: GIY-YIG nuclease family protein [Syntrophomonadaceae bacterium]|nr:GIY-YIG nuclease family protein [Syntrophomonadaceae bacterium]